MQLTDYQRDLEARHAAYRQYQTFAQSARKAYAETSSVVWADIEFACVQLSLTESRTYPEIFAGMREVTQDEFYAAVGPLNCHPSVRSSYSADNYGSDFVMLDNSRRIVGRTLNVGDTPHYKPITRYFLP